MYIVDPSIDGIFHGSVMGKGNGSDNTCFPVNTTEELVPSFNSSLENTELFSNDLDRIVSIFCHPQISQAGAIPLETAIGLVFLIGLVIGSILFVTLLFPFYDKLNLFSYFCRRNQSSIHECLRSATSSRYMAGATE